VAATTFSIAMGWHAHLQLDYRHDGTRTTALDRHQGPLRVLQRLYPEGDAICHHVLVHPPGGIVGGDTLDLQATLAAGSHAVITTPGATRFYRSDGALSLQQVQATLAAGARLEWLPMETIAYSGCVADNRLCFELAPGAQMLGWDVLALGLPAANAGFVRGRFRQAITLPGVWQERGLIDAADDLLLTSPLGLAGHTVMASLWLAEGLGEGAVNPHGLDRARTEALLDAAREHIAASDLPTTAGVSAPHPSLLVLRALGHRVEPVMALLQAVRGAWRQLHWGLAPNPPRLWRT
jgi:urease accessory protein